MVTTQADLYLSRLTANKRTWDHSDVDDAKEQMPLLVAELEQLRADNNRLRDTITAYEAASTVGTVTLRIGERRNAANDDDNDAKRARKQIASLKMPALVFGVWCAVPSVNDLWSVTHRPTGMAVPINDGANGPHVDWWTAVYLAERLHHAFKDRPPAEDEARPIINAALEWSETFIHSTDWMK